MEDNTVYSSDFVDLNLENPPKKKLYKPFGIVSMIFGILSLASYVASFSMPFAFLYPFVGLLFASFDLKRNKERSSFGIVGYFTSIAGLIILIFITLFFVMIIALMVLLFIFTYKEIGSI